jgi:sugar/nucleoside kinase (ribokinase family)
MKDPTLERKVVDTTGAGDAFTGAFAVRYTETKGDISDSLKFASAMGFCAVSKFGCGKNCVASREEISEILDMNTRRTSFN